MTGSAASDANGRSLSSLIPRAFLEEAARGFAIDTRALAAFRIAVGLLVLLDLLWRIPHFHTFYTDAGVLPRSVLREEFSILASVSLHALSGEPWVQGFPFAVMALLAVGLVIGYRSRLIMAALLVLYASLYARNPYVLYGGDGLLLVALLLGPFLPVGARWSIDAWGRDTPPKQVLNLASATLLSQLGIIYTANAFFKFQGSQWVAGGAIRRFVTDRARTTANVDLVRDRIRFHDRNGARSDSNRTRPRTIGGRPASHGVPEFDQRSDRGPR